MPINEQKQLLRETRHRLGTDAERALQMEMMRPYRTKNIIVGLSLAAMIGGVCRFLFNQVKLMIY